MKRRTHLIAAILALALLVTLMPAETIQAANAAPAKLSAKDFIVTDDKGTQDFLEQTQGDEWAYAWVYKKTATKGQIRTDKTNRNVKLGSTASFVKKQYGKTAKAKVDKTDRIYKTVQYEYPEIDVSVWKSYLEYTYKAGINTYKLRFYLGKNNKVTAMFYIKNLKMIYKYPNKEANPELTFQAPAGKSITTKKINGKTVYMVPRGTRIQVAKSMDTAAYIYRYDTYGNISDETIPDYLAECLAWDNMSGVGDTMVAPGKSYDLETVINAGLSLWGTYKENMLDFDNLGKYLYFVLYVDGKGQWDLDADRMNYTRAPKIYYFKFK